MKKQRIHNTHGFTLMEMIIVIALIAVIAGLAITRFEGIFGGSQEQAAQIWVKDSVKTPLTTYRIHMGSYPSTAEGLHALLVAPAGKEGKWKGPYVESLTDDPWGHPYQYRFPGVKNKDKYDVYSFGPDGVESDDDIGNW